MREKPVLIQQRNFLRARALQRSTKERLTHHPSRSRRHDPHVQYFEDHRGLNGKCLGLEWMDYMQRTHWLAFLCMGLMVPRVRREARQAAQGDELEVHLAAQRKQMEDPKRTLADRARIALELAATLDRAAQTTPSAEARRARWKQAVSLLDDFNSKKLM